MEKSERKVVLHNTMDKIKMMHAKNRVVLKVSSGVNLLMTVKIKFVLKDLQLKRCAKSVR